MQVKNVKKVENLYIKTYGCQMNVYDSILITDIMRPLGFQVVENIEIADLIIINTCHIREKATEKLYSLLGRINVMAKNQNKRIKLVVAGCVAQAEGEEIFSRAPYVDVVVGPQSIHSLPELVMKINRKTDTAINLDFPVISKFDQLPNELPGLVAQGASAFLSIQEGCDKFCTFCVVPYTRGAEYSREVAKIYREALLLVEKGAQEIVLLGQNVNAYHGKHEGEVWSLGRLIRYLAKIPGLKRIRYTTSHPVDMHEELYIAHAEEEKLMPFLHLPVQSGSNRILRNMNRKHTTEQYIKIIARLRSLRPDIQFSSDFIIGFPGESEQDFEKTLALVKEVEYASAYSFKYSPRPGTPGAERKDQINDDIKSERLCRLQELLKIQQISYNQSTVGKVMPVLFDHKNKRSQITGKTPYMQSVYLDNNKYHNKIANVFINHAGQNSLTGEVVGEYTNS